MNLNTCNIYSVYCMIRLAAFKIEKLIKGGMKSSLNHH